MKLAQALLLRADMKQRLIGLRERIGSNCTVQEGDELNENPQDLNHLNREALPFVLLHFTTSHRRIRPLCLLHKANAKMQKQSKPLSFSQRRIIVLQ